MVGEGRERMGLGVVWPDLELRKCESSLVGDGMGTGLGGGGEGGGDGGGLRGIGDGKFEAGCLGFRRKN